MATPPKPTKQDIYGFISDAASYGNLGLFIGTGFSKAVLNNEHNQIAVSWGELLEKISGMLEINYGQIAVEGIGYPEIASRICAEYAKKNGVTYRQSLSEIKRRIASLTSWYPEQNKRVEYWDYFESLAPSWIITTNYDLVIESLWTGRTIPLGPSDQLTNPKNVVPVFHLHGIRTNPEEIVIAQEDYVSLFRPNDYRQMKLALTLTESTVLLLGYGLGDVNVLTALDWSKHVFTTGSTDFPHEVIQLVRKTNPSETPYQDRNGIWIIETDELAHFFSEYVEVRKKENVKEVEHIKGIVEIQKVLNAPSQDIINKFIDDSELRNILIKGLSSFPIYLASGFISFLDKCLSETWARCAPNGAFEGYNQNLILLLDIFTGFSTKNIPPALFQTAAFGLQQLAPMIGMDSGQSWSAAKTWKNRKGEISTDMIQELNNIAELYSYTNIKQLLSTI